MQRLVDSAVGVAKESVKTLTREAFNNTLNIVNGASAFLLEFVPAKARIAETLKGWEVRPTVRAPRLPQWMEDGYSSLNKFIYDADSDTSSDSEYESGAEDALSEASLPASPSSSMSYHSSGSGYFSPSPSVRPHYAQRRPRTWWHVLKRIFWFFFWPLAIFFPRKRQQRRPSGGMYFPSRSTSASISGEPQPRMSRTSSNSSLSRHFSMASQELSKRLNDMMEYVTHLNDNRRRGVIEDFHLLLELAIERVFEAVRGILYYSMAPWTSLKIIANGLMGRRPTAAVHVPTVSTTTLGDSRASPKQRPVRLADALNADSRTCNDIVTDAGYPYESRKVITKDGYVLTLERIPRRESGQVVLLQHGILDSSLGWVSNGPVGSQAFAAYDQGYDVWLGNMRGYANREHINKRISAREYWNYSVNEHGMYDIGAMVDCIHETKLEELRGTTAAEVEAADGELPDGSPEDPPPYVLSGVAHSLGGAAVMMYVVTQRIKKEPQRFSRLILLSPAGFHEKVPFLISIFAAMVPVVEPFMTRFMPGLFIPTRSLRLLFNKLMQDFQNLPALRALVQVLISSVVLGGDTSDWVGALRQPHYNMYDMPGLAFRVIKHMNQLWMSTRFIMFDYGSARANLAAYGQPKPIDLGANYGLVDIPVDVVMGRKDAIIPPSMVIRHYELLKAAGRETSIKEFEFAHLDFTFAQHQELLAYVMARLNLTSRKANFGAFRTSPRPSLTVRTLVSASGENTRQVAAAPLPLAEASEEDEQTWPTEGNGHTATERPANGKPGTEEVLSYGLAQNEHVGGKSLLKGTLEARKKVAEGNRKGAPPQQGAVAPAADGASEPAEERPREALDSSSRRNDFEESADSLQRRSHAGNGSPYSSTNGSHTENGSLKRQTSSKRRGSSISEIEEVDESQETLDAASHRWRREASAGENIVLPNGSPSSGLVVQLSEIADTDLISPERPHGFDERPWITNPGLSSEGLRQRVR